MSTAREPRWSQPTPSRADQNLKLVQRKIDQNLKSGLPGVEVTEPAGRLELPGAPDLMAQLARPRTAERPSDASSRRPERPRPTPAPTLSSTDVETVMTPRDDRAEFLAKANVARLAKQWDDVTARLCREFAPDGDAGTERVLRLIEEQRLILDDATVRDYLPVLVDRSVRKILGDPTSTT